jgi:hypothetical protein
VDRKDQEGWESFQRMTEGKKRKLGRDSRLHVAIPDESFESKQRLGLGCLKSQVTFSLAPTHIATPTPSSLDYQLSRLLYALQNRTEIAKDHGSHHYRQLSRFMSKSKPSFHTTSRGPVTAVSTFRLKYLVSGGSETMEIVHLTW